MLIFDSKSCHQYHLLADCCLLRSGFWKVEAFWNKVQGKNNHAYIMYFFGGGGVLTINQPHKQYSFLHCKLHSQCC